MRKSFILIATCFLVAVLSAPSQTHAADPTIGGGAGGGGPTCNLDAYNNSLFGTESAGAGGYEAMNGSGDVCANGMYQFIPDTARSLEAYQNAPASCQGLCVRGAGLNRAACSEVQEAMQYEFTMRNLRTIQTSSKCAAARAAAESGSSVTGYGVSNYQRYTIGPCAATYSGLLAGAHLGGVNGMCAAFRNGTDPDDTRWTGGRAGKSVRGYVCQHGGHPVPGAQCTPPDFNYPTGTTGETTPYTPGPITPWQGDTPAAGPSLDNDARLKSLWVASLQQMTNQLVTTMMQQVQIIGSFFDAKHQLETQRINQQKTAEAHKRFHPSEQLCKIGTFARNLNESEERTILTHAALTEALMARAMMSGDVTTSEIGADEDTKQLLYLGKFCNKADNAGQMKEICTESIPSDLEGADINFTQSIGAPLTLDINLLDGTSTPNEVTLFSFMNELFMHNSFPWLSKQKTELAAFVEPYMEMRSLIAIRSVAQNSLAYMVAQKAASTPEDAESAAPFLRAMLSDMGIAPDEMDGLIGKNPSYYAQMEFLTRKIYYHPEFVSNLYDKPDNIKRMAAAMTAIKSMQNWQINEALERREMLYSVLLELKLREKQNQLETIDIPTALYGQPDGIGP